MLYNHYITKKNKGFKMSSGYKLLTVCTLLTILSIGGLVMIVKEYNDRQRLLFDIQKSIEKVQIELIKEKDLK